MISGSHAVTQVSRAGDVAYLMDCIADAQCCAVVGLSNTGKSVLLRSLTRPEVRRQYLGPRANEHVFVYVDFNLMVELTEQGFYEVILRSTQNELQKRDVKPELMSRIADLYHQVVDATSPFRVPLSFNESLISISEGLGQPIVFLFDEFDEPFQNLDGRVFLNLRALRDRYQERLSYVVATCRRLREMRNEPEVAEFCELFAHHTRFLTMLNQEDIHRTVLAFAREEGITFTEEDVAFVSKQAGGHPGLIQVVCQVLADEPAIPRNYRRVLQHLDGDINVRTECAKLWNDLTPQEQKALINFLSTPRTMPPREVEHALREKGVLITDQAGRRQVFGELFAGFARRQRLVRGPTTPGIRVDVDSGDVYVEGRLVPELTDLEYRLMLLLYGRLGKICDKYTIVENVWGEEYIEEVDDARIEKLVSRLRRKIEPDPANPRYLITVRGRGYRLVSD